MNTQLDEAIRSRLEFIGAQWCTTTASLSIHHERGGVEAEVEGGGECRLLDYASGTGRITLALQKHISFARGIDISENMVAAYNDRMATEGLASNKAKAVVGNLLSKELSHSIEEPEFANFDVAAVGLGFHHFEDTQLTLERLVERLKSGTGVFLILDWLPSAEDEKYQGQAHHHHHHDHHGQQGSQATAKNPEETRDDFAHMRHTIAHDGFNEEMMRKLYENAGLTDFAFEVLEEPIRMVIKGNLVQRSLFLARGRKK